MIVKTGLLVLTNPLHIRSILPTINKQVKNTLYIHLTNTLADPFPRYKSEIFTSPVKYSKTIRGIYAEAAALCQNLDIRVLLSSLKYSTVRAINTAHQVETVIFDKMHEKSQIDSFINNNVVNKKTDYNIWILEGNSCSVCPESPTGLTEKTYKHAVLGGTFDRLHTGHKILLTEAILNAEEKVTVGVTDTNMISAKLLWELIEPCEIRLKGIKTFLNDVCCELNYSVVPIQDPFGPTKSDPTMDIIIVSAETLRGGEKVNEVRQKNGLNPLEINCIDLIDSPVQENNEEPKISSSNNRMKLLGTLLREPNKNLPVMNPYIIGLTGGIASGKSSVCKRLAALGAEILDCDKIAHDVYKPGKPCHKMIQEAFGDEVIAENGEINRRVLGGIVFADKSKLALLNSIVWPGIITEVQKIISSIRVSSGSAPKIVVIDAAVLLTAGWDKECHEVWSCMIPAEEAVKRIKNRNNLSEEEARKRIGSQMTNSEVVGKSNVVFSTFWEPDYTQKLVERAWNFLHLRLQDGE